ncbi:MAG TPA: cobalamin biosynthesis protein CobD [Proteobacteria bacterium]|nr:cobalamin biosynthesis protein CobD [Pseudomonadota bacterium]
MKLVLIVAIWADFIFADKIFARFHPVIGIGHLISWLEKILYPTKENHQKELWAGFLLTGIVLALTFAVVWGLIYISRLGGFPVYVTVSCYLLYAGLACGGLAAEAVKVIKALQDQGISEARMALARIVGRQTRQLSEEDIQRAVIETVAENLSDGVIAPLFYFFIGGIPLVWIYKAINTLDSMVGYKNRRYLYFGRFAARLDDVANFIPARISAMLILLAAFIQGLDWRAGWRILIRDHGAHASPNSAYPEAAMAGVLGLRLGGDNFYHGQLVVKPFIGDDREVVSLLHVRRAIAILYLSSALFAAILFFGV